jgi:Icc protein
MEKLDSKGLTYNITPSNMDVVRLVQVTDSHIYSDPAAKLLGVNTRESFEAVCLRVQKEEWRPDALLVTGDLSQDSSAESYQYLEQSLNDMAIPSFWLAGNHDDPETMMACLSKGSVSTAKKVIIGNWLIILLDSSVANKVYGELSEQQLNFLKNGLKEHPDKHALVSLHHHPINVNSDWIDNVGLKNTEEFTHIIEQNKQVKAVIWGHIHQEYHCERKGVQWIATPSSCVQFTPKSKNFSADVKAPGYRYLSLYADGKVDTVVHRVDDFIFSVDDSVIGY